MESLSPTNQPTRPPVWQLVVRKPYDASGVSEFAFWLKEKSLGYLVGEHPADDEVKTTHCHILIEGLKVTDEALRKSLKRCDISGSDYSLMKKRKSKNGIREDYQTDYLGIYIIKGEIPYVKSTSFNDAQIALWASKWTRYVERSETEQGALQGVAELATAKRPKTDYDKCQEILDTELFSMINTDENPNVFNIKQGKFHENAQSRVQIVRGIVDWGRRTRTALHPRKVMDYYGIVLQNACPERYTDLIVDLINNQYRHSHK